LSGEIGVGVVSCEIVIIGALPIHLFRTFAVGCIVLPQGTASQTDGQTNGQ